MQQDWTVDGVKVRARYRRTTIIGPWQLWRCSVLIRSAEIWSVQPWPEWNPDCPLLHVSWRHGGSLQRVIYARSFETTRIKLISWWLEHISLQRFLKIGTAVDSPQDAWTFSFVQVFQNQNASEFNRTNSPSLQTAGWMPSNPYACVIW